MSINEILDAVSNGKICPFTKKPYDCARCKAENYKTDWTNKGTHIRHLGLCITQPLEFGEEGWQDVLCFFHPPHRNAARKIITELIKFGVEQVPISACDFEHFCFKRGCDGHKSESEVK